MKQKYVDDCQLPDFFAARERSGEFAREVEELSRSRDQVLDVQGSYRPAVQLFYVFVYSRRGSLGTRKLVGRVVRVV